MTVIFSVGCCMLAALLKTDLVSSALWKARRSWQPVSSFRCHLPPTPVRPFVEMAASRFLLQLGPGKICHILMPKPCVVVETLSAQVQSRVEMGLAATVRALVP